MLETIGFLIIVLAAAVYLVTQWTTRWALAKQKRDSWESLRPGAGITYTDHKGRAGQHAKKPAAIPFLFK